jgi:hypothetical protein
VIPLIYDGLCKDLKEQQGIFIGNAAIGLVFVAPLNEKVCRLGAHAVL